MDNYRHLKNRELPDDIYLAMGDIALDKQAEDFLNEKEKKEGNAFKSTPRREEYISTRLLVKRLAAELGYDPFALQIVKDEMGKPFGKTEEEKLFLSLAHSKSVVLCGISENKDIGIDLEPVDRKVGRRLGERILHPDESEGLGDVELIRIWTIKEALVKLEGGGLRTNLNEVQVARDSNTGFSGRFNNDKKAKICSFRHRKHWVSVAYFR